MGLTQKLGTIPLAILTDASNNIGIGGSPSGTYKLEVTGTAKVSTSAYFAIASGSVGIGTITPTSYFYSGNGLAIYNASQNTLSIATDTSGTSSLYFSNGASGAARYNGYLEYIHSTNSMTFGTGGFTRLTLTSSSAAFSGSVTSSANGSTFGTASAGGRSIILQADSGNGAITFRNAAGGDGNLLVTGTSTSLNYRFDTYSVGNALAISNAGNVGIGIVPFTWNSIFVGIDFVNKGGVNSYTNYLALSQNLYYGTGALDGWRYKTTGYAAAINIESDSGAISFKATSSSGTADAAASTFVEKMRLTSGGNLQLNNGTSLRFNNTAGAAVDTLQMFTDGNVYLDAKDNTGGNIIFRTSTSLNERIRITKGGTLQFSDNPTSNYEIDSSTRISIAVGGTFAFANFSGMVVVTNMSNGATGIWLVGSGTTSLVSTVGGSAGLGTFAYTSGNAGYTWTSNYSVTANYGFFAVRTRPEA